MNSGALQCRPTKNCTRGRTAQGAGKLDEAAAVLERLTQQDPSYALAHSALAVIYGRLKRHDEAIRHGLKVCELEPNEPFSFTAMSVTFQRAGKIPEAEDAMARARMLQAAALAARSRSAADVGRSDLSRAEARVVDRVANDLVGAGAAAMLGDEQAARQLARRRGSCPCRSACWPWPAGRHRPAAVAISRRASFRARWTAASRRSRRGRRRAVDRSGCMLAIVLPKQVAGHPVRFLAQDLVIDVFEQLELNRFAWPLGRLDAVDHGAARAAHKIAVEEVDRQLELARPTRPANRARRRSPARCCVTRRPCCVEHVQVVAHDAIVGEKCGPPRTAP